MRRRYVFERRVYSLTRVFRVQKSILIDFSSQKIKYLNKIALVIVNLWERWETCQTLLKAAVVNLVG